MSTQGVRAAMERAVAIYYDGPSSNAYGVVFTLATFSKALREMSGELIGGNLCRVILADRDDVEQFGLSDCYRRIKPPSKSNAARILGMAGGKATAANMTKDQRKDRAREAAAARWKKHK